MIRSMYTAASGMLVRGTDQFDMYAHNLANASTPGFRAQYIHQTSLANPDGEGAPTDVQVTYSGNYEDPSLGPKFQTGQKFDLALEGEGFFAVESASGEEAYTRNGRFVMDSEGYVRNSAGNPLMGEVGPIRVPTNASEILVGGDGSVSADGVNIGQIKRIVFPSDQQPNPAGGGLYFARQGVQPVESDVGVLQGYYEGSNISVVEEMVRLIEASRSVEAYQKVILTAGEETTAALVRQTGKVG